MRPKPWMTPVRTKKLCRFTELVSALAMLFGLTTPVLAGPTPTPPIPIPTPTPEPLCGVLNPLTAIVTRGKGQSPTNNA